MNSRNSVNESNLVNLSANLSTLDSLDSKDSLSLSFPFDHIYACHSEGSERRQTLSVDKDVEISTHCVVTEQKDLLLNTSTEISRLSERLNAAENQNKKLKDLLIYHLDLIQQQNDVITKREKLYQALKQENDSLKSKVTRMDRKGSTTHKPTISFPAPIIHTPPIPVIKSEPGTSSQVMLNSINELLLPDNRPDPYIFNDVAQPTPYAPDPYDISRPSDPSVPDYFSNYGVSSILDSNLSSDNTTMIENKQSSYIKKEIKKESKKETKKDIKKETRPEPLYTITSNSGNPVIKKCQRSRRRTSSGIGSLSRMPKVPPVTPETEFNLTVDDDTRSEATFSVNKKSKMINTYGKSKSNILKCTTQYTGSLSDRLKLIDTTPTGEDPYQIGEAEMREQSPIPKLMLQKSSTGRMRAYGNSNFTSGSTITSRRIYDIPATQTSTSEPLEIKLESRYDLPSLVTQSEIKKEPKDTSSNTLIHGTDTVLNKTESDNEWRITNASISNFGQGDSNSSQMLPHLISEGVKNLLANENCEEATKAAEALENIDLKILDFCNDMLEDGTFNEIEKKRETPSTSLMDTDFLSEQPAEKRGTSSKRGRKRALSTTGLSKGKNTKSPKTRQPKGKAASRGKKSPVPGMMSTKAYYTSMGDPDLTWYNSLDGDLKIDDIDQPGPSTAASTVELPGTLMGDPDLSWHYGLYPEPNTQEAQPGTSAAASTVEFPGTLMGDPSLSWHSGLYPELNKEDINQPGTSAPASTVEVPRWREKPVASSYTLEGTENVDDKIYEKRHQKLEAEERRQLRWHMRRVREQRHVERLRQRQRDSWCSGLTSSAYQQPSVYTIWPQPQRDARVIEITDKLPVLAFGEDLPELPPADFMLPWVRTSKALKRSKRSKTLH